MGPLSRPLSRPLSETRARFVQCFEPILARGSQMGVRKWVKNHTF